jgi:hypothetical protein
MWGIRNQSKPRVTDHQPCAIPAEAGIRGRGFEVQHEKFIGYCIYDDLRLDQDGYTRYHGRGVRGSMKQAGDAEKRSAAVSWLVVLGLSLVIFATLRGIAWLCGGVDPYIFHEWTGQSVWTVLAALLVLLLLVLLGAIIVRNRRHNPRRLERRALTLGSWVIYLPAFIGGLPAVVGLVASMVTPFLGGGLIAIAALLLEEAGVLPHDVGDWIARGIVHDTGYEESQTRFMLAQILVAAGLAIAIVGFIQVFRAYREKRLQTQGLYATVRHPQHLGIGLWTFGLAFAVSGTAGYITWFTVLYFYVLLALREERRLAQPFGSVYEDYRGATPFMIPFVNIGLPLPRSGVLRIAALITYYAAGMAVLCLILQSIGVEHGFM